MIRCRTKTTGIVNVEFIIDNKKFKLTDVGGQRSERKKWIHCFDDANAILFIVAMSEYDLKCYEDDSTPRMNESLQLFEEICNNKYFTNTPIVLLLNKDDVFREKIKKTPLKVWDNQYTGEDGDYDAALKHIQKRFLSKNHVTERKIDVFVCTTTETGVVQKVFEEVKKAIISTKEKQKK